MASDEFQAAGAKVVTALAKDAIVAFGGVLNAAARRVKVELKLGFGPYLEQAALHVGTVKVITRPSTPTMLEDVYSSAEILAADKVLSESDFLDHWLEIKRVIVLGPGGSGKTFFVRRLFLHIIERSWPRLPIFIEMRDWTDADFESSLLDRLRAALDHSSLALDAGQIMTLAKKGMLAVLLDGFDELPMDARGKTAREIREFGRLYPDCLIAVSSRDGPEFGQWSTFHEVRLLPPGPGRTAQIIRKTDVAWAIFADQRGRLALTKKQKALFENLPTPLHVMLAVVSHFEVAKIGSGRAEQIRQAFYAVARRHDIQKGTFQRVYYTAISLDELQRLVSFVALQCVLSGRFAWSHFEMCAFADAAIKKEGREATISADLLMRDMLEGCSVLARSGKMVAFLIPAYRQYFAAQALKTLDGSNFERVLSMVLDRDDDPEILHLLFELDPHKVKICWLRPAAETVWRLSQDGQALADNSLYREARNSEEFSQAVERLCGVLTKSKSAKQNSIGNGRRSRPAVDDDPIEVERAVVSTAVTDILRRVDEMNVLGHAFANRKPKKRK